MKKSGYSEENGTIPHIFVSSFHLYGAYSPDEARGVLPDGEWEERKSNFVAGEEMGSEEKTGAGSMLILHPC